MNRLLLSLLLVGVVKVSGQVNCNAFFSELTDTSLTASFISSSPNLPNGLVEYRTWDFGDGQSVSYTGRKFKTSHAYAVAGWYKVVQSQVAIDFRGDTVCSAVYSDSIPVGLIYNPHSWSVKLSAPDTLNGYSIKVTDSSVAHTSPAPWDEEILFFEENSGLTRLGAGGVTNHTSGDGAGWVLRNQGDNLVCMSKQYRVSGTLVNEAWDCKNVYVDPPVTTTASISYTQNQSVHGEVNFTATSSSTSIDTSMQKEQWSWSFGDGTGGSGKTVTHVYPGSGEYRVVFAYMVKNKNTNMVEGYSRVVDTVVIQPVAYCSADFDFKQYGRMDNKSLNYYSPYSTGVRYEWYFEDGTTSTDENPIHALTKYANPITLVQVVEDAQYNVLCSDTITHIVYNTGGVNPLCRAEYEVDSAQTGNSVITIVNTSTPQPGDSGYAWINYTWDFGDGSTSNQAYPTHVYADSGTYNLCLSVEAEDFNGDSCTATFCKTVGVDSLGNIIYKSSGGFTINVVAPNTVSVDEQKLLDLAIYPNPASTSVNVEGMKEGGEWSLYNIQGASVAEGYLEPGESKIDFGTKKPGLYILNLQSRGYTKSMKLSIK